MLDQLVEDHGHADGEAEDHERRRDAVVRPNLVRVRVRIRVRVRVRGRGRVRVRVRGSRATPPSSSRGRVRRGAGWSRAWGTARR